MRDGGRQKRREELEKRRIRHRMTCTSSVSPRFMNIGKSIVSWLRKEQSRRAESGGWLISRRYGGKTVRRPRLLRMNDKIMLNAVNKHTIRMEILAFRNNFLYYIPPML